MTDNWASLLKGDLERISAVFSRASGAVTEKLLEGERRNVAVLFLDLHGFTSLSEKLDHETLHKLTSGVMKALSRIVEAHGGYVDKFEGDRIMALFGAQRTHDNDSIRAVHCALRMLDTIADVDQVLSDRNLALSARAGISFGAVTVAPDPSGHLTATGEEVNIASRLESSAELDTVQVTERVRNECGEQFQWEPLGVREVKGWSRGVSTYRPTGPGAVQTRRWERASRVAESPFVGRELELSMLEQAWQEQRHSTNRNRRGGARHIIVGVLGEPGVGKSRLVHEFLERTRIDPDSNVGICTGQTLSFAQPPLQLFASLRSDLERIASSDTGGQLPDEGSVSLLDAALGSGVALVGPTEREIRESSPNHGEVLVAIRDLVRRASGEDRCLVLVLEDYQWIDTSSKEALEFVFSSCDTPRPILFLVTCRSGTGGGPGPLQDLSVHPDFADVRFIELPVLRESDSMELASGMLAAAREGKASRGLQEDLRKLILDRSGGNPFFIEELVLSLVSSGGVTPGESEWVLTDGGDLTESMPGTVAGLLRSRIDSLPPNLRRALQICSVLEPEFDTGEYHYISSRTGQDSSGIDLISLTALGFLNRIEAASPEEEHRYRFRQLLLKEAVYETLLKHNRSVLHRLAAEYLTENSRDLNRSAPAIAKHWEEAGEIGHAIEWGVLALSQFRSSWEHDQGMALASKLMTWLGDMEPDQQWADWMLSTLNDMAGIRMNRAEHDEQALLLERMLEIAREWDRPEWLAHGLWSLGDMKKYTGFFDESERAFEESLELFRELGDREGEGSVLASLGSLSYMRGQFERALEYNREALPIHVETGNDRGEANANTDIGMLLGRLGEHEESMLYLEKAVELQREVGNLRGLAITLSNLGIALRRSDYDIAGTREKFLEALEVHRSIGNIRSEGVVLANLAALDSEEGKVESSLALVEEALVLSRQAGNRRHVCIALNTRGWALRKLDRLQEALETFAEAADLATEMGLESALQEATAGRAVVLSDMKRTEEALALYLEAVAFDGEVSTDTSTGVGLEDCRTNLLEQGVDEEVLRKGRTD